MNREVLLILVDNRRQVAPEVQKILTCFGCYIKTRLGIHDNVLNQCSETGLIFLELVGEKDKHNDLISELDALEGVDAKLVSLAIA